MKTINLKSILTFCILGTLFLNTHAHGQTPSNRVSSSELGVDLTPHLTGGKIIFFTNWTAAYHSDPNGAIKVVAQCMDVRRTSTELEGINFVLKQRQSSVLPARGYNWSDWLEGTQICEGGDIIRLRSVLTVGGIDYPANDPFKLYKNGEPVKTDDAGHPLISYSCFGGGFQFPHIRYMPADKYDQPKRPYRSQWTLCAF